MTQELFDKLCEVAAQTFADVFLIGIAALVANFLLERYKSNQALRNEIAKMRVTRLDEVWITLNELESALDSSMKFLHTELPEGANLGMLIGPYAEREDRARAEVTSAINKHRFWLGETLHGRIQEYISTLEEHAHARFSEFRTEESAKLEKVIQSKRQSVLEFLKHPDE